MKKLIALTSMAGTAGVVLTLITACQTTNTADVGSQKEALLTQSGFKSVAVTTPKQQQAVGNLAHGRVSAVKYNGKLYYVYPTAQNNQVLVGKQKHYNNYKQALASQQGQPGQQLINPAPTMSYETAGPNHIEVQQFDGFGPMGTASLGDW